MNWNLQQAHELASQVNDIESGNDAVNTIHDMRRGVMEEMRSAAERGDNDYYNELSEVRYDLLQVIRSIQAQMGRYAAKKIALKHMGGTN